jgi:hypothetical protein
VTWRFEPPDFTVRVVRDADWDLPRVPHLIADLVGLAAVCVGLVVMHRKGEMLVLY